MRRCVAVLVRRCCIVHRGSELLLHEFVRNRCSRFSLAEQRDLHTLRVFKNRRRTCVQKKITSSLMKNGIELTHNIDDLPPPLGEML